MSVPTLLLVSASAGAGNTTICLGIARALVRRGHRVAIYKSGPDPRDTSLHAWALHQPSLNLDSWALRFDTLLGLLDDTAEGMDIVLGDGQAGLLDGDAGGSGSDADLSSLLGIPVMLVIDAAGAGRSLAPMIEGLLRARDDIEIGGIFLNRVASAAHAGELIHAFDERFSTPVLGYLIDDPAFELDEHHYRSARALEAEDVDDILDEIEQAVLDVADLDRLLRIARPPSVDAMALRPRPLPQLGQRIAVAQDEAFAFAHEAILTGWHRQGAQLFPFSPLADEAPSAYADAIYLPSGPLDDYAGLLASRRDFMKGLAEAATRRATIYGEGLGYGVLGEFLIDAHDERHAMAALLPLTTRARATAMAAGHRRLRLCARHALGPAGTQFRGFDRGALLEVECRTERLFSAQSADGADLGDAGAIFETAAGSPIALLDRHLHLAVVRG